ncbi:hypothetical protein BDQ12DRAFT_730171 [Crucibulum laeve]|uniref:Uncharacterized protein n=1 Tax=Crucibulum laeve TaxID=68775 RepID=A0A5C3MFP4_9AGAR|nr:hypothetical protein BDQ12DRAFT_730171 [Crucibulum laeve]
MFSKLNFKLAEPQDAIIDAGADTLSKVSEAIYSLDNASVAKLHDPVQLVKAVDEVDTALKLAMETHSSKDAKEFRKKATALSEISQRQLEDAGIKKEGSVNEPAAKPARKINPTIQRAVDNAAVVLKQGLSLLHEDVDVIHDNDLSDLLIQYNGLHTKCDAVLHGKSTREAKKLEKDSLAFKEKVVSTSTSYRAQIAEAQKAKAAAEEAPEVEVEAEASSAAALVEAAPSSEPEAPAIAEDSAEPAKLDDGVADVEASVPQANVAEPSTSVHSPVSIADSKSMKTKSVKSQKRPSKDFVKAQALLSNLKQELEKNKTIIVLDELTVLQAREEELNTQLSSLAESSGKEVKKLDKDVSEFKQQVQTAIARGRIALIKNICIKVSSEAAAKQAAEASMTAPTAIESTPAAVVPMPVVASAA